MHNLGKDGTRTRIPDGRFHSRYTYLGQIGSCDIVLTPTKQMLFAYDIKKRAVTLDIYLPTYTENKYATNPLITAMYNLYTSNEDDTSI